MKWLLLATLLFAQGAYCQKQNLTQEDSLQDGGTGAGNGDGASERDAYLKSVKDTLGKEEDEANSSAQSLTAWSGRALSVLQRGKARAISKLYEDKPDEAYNTLLSTLTAVAQSLRTRTADSGPMTRKLVYRTLKYTQRLDQDLTASQSPISPVNTKLNLLFNSYEFIIDVANSLDRDYYIPFHYRYGGAYPVGYPNCGSCGGHQFNYGEYQARFLKFAARQLDFIRKVMTTTSRSQYMIYDIVPKGSHEGFLAVAEMMTKYVWSDVRQNIYAYGNIDAIANLGMLKDDLKEFNTQNDRTVFRGKEEAVHGVATVIDTIRCQLRDYCLSYFCGHKYDTCNKGNKCTYGGNDENNFTFNITIY